MNLFPLTEDLSIILLHAGRKDGQTCASTLIQNQVTTIRTVYGHSIEIIVVLGYMWEEIINKLPRGVRAVINPIYEKTSSATSTMLGIQATTKKHLYVINGDYLLKRSVFRHTNQSYIIVQSRMGGRDDIGVIIQDGVRSFSYGLPDQSQWAGFIYLVENDVDMFLTCYDRRLLMYEVFNNMIDQELYLGVKYDS